VATISTLAERFRSTGGEGTTAVIEVVTMDGHTFVPAIVQRRPPRIIFEIGPDDPSATTREIVLIREDDIRRVQMRREPTGHGVGFRVDDVIPD
jgi:hypothetical protein